ncbi:MAG: tagaturonate epimerase family protein, partial [Spirochaetia bacterium]|nr:tagaturonate epimerase family protein [Spirochaetia bacterium]
MIRQITIGMYTFLNDNHKDLTKDSLYEYLNEQYKLAEKDTYTYFHQSLQYLNETYFFNCTLQKNSEKNLFIISNTFIPFGFNGEFFDYNGIYGQEIPVSWENAVILHTLFPYTKPVSLRDKKTTFGCGDRLGLAT